MHKGAFTLSYSHIFCLSAHSCHFPNIYKYFVNKAVGIRQNKQPHIVCIYSHMSIFAAHTHTHIITLIANLSLYIYKHFISTRIHTKYISYLIFCVFAAILLRILADVDAIIDQCSHQLSAMISKLYMG